MRAIVGPLAARLDELAGGDHRGMTNDGDGFTLAARLHAQNAEAVVFVMKCYPLDEASKDFRRWLLFAAIDCLTRSSPEHLRLRIFFHNRERACFIRQ